MRTSVWNYSMWYFSFLFYSSATSVSVTSLVSLRRLATSRPLRFYVQDVVSRSSVLFWKYNRSLAFIYMSFPTADERKIAVSVRMRVSTASCYIRTTASRVVGRPLPGFVSLSPSSLCLQLFSVSNPTKHTAYSSFLLFNKRYESNITEQFGSNSNASEVVLWLSKVQISYYPKWGIWFHRFL
jgi:hypothetical protein